MPDNKHYIYSYYALFTLSGFTGLIYESIWTHYLKLFLGHAAYAQVLVLVIFMGGMAIGAAWAGKRTARMTRLLLAYAVIEAVIGVFAIFYHPLFTNTVNLAYTSLLPGMQNTTLVSLTQWTLAALLILPQSILLGMTFPYMSAGVIRVAPERSGRTLAILYFSNSLGAAIGVLLAGFVLIKYLGLPKTMIVAGLMNIALALLVAALWWSSRTQSQHTQVKHQSTQATQRNLFYWMLALCALFTGFASFLYELGWIRMLSLVLGTTTHSFELMLSSFILGLAIGGFWIRKRIDNLVNPIKTLATIQIVMGLLGILTLVLYGYTFKAMTFTVTALDTNEQGYLLFNLVSHGIALLIMLPATICAGMTLPIITNLLLNKGYGERSIGTVYAFNTLGAISGIAITVTVLMPMLGLKYVILAGGLVDIVVGLGLFYYVRQSLSKRWQLATTLVPLAAMIVVAVFVQLDSLKMASGVYISGKIKQNREILYHKDGKTASIAFFRTGSTLSISTNGKIEASIDKNDITKDEPTMVLVAAFPMAMKPDAKTAAVIGIGSGLTTHTLLNSKQFTQVDTIEIEPAMVEAARLFGKPVENTFTDARSRIHIEDAKAYFNKHNKQYDIIISEPSNPWVSGVSGLFSIEYYRNTKRFMRSDSLFVQWLHLYHIDMSLVASVNKALAQEFSDYRVYALNHSDLVIVAVKQGRVPVLSDKLFEQTRLKQQLQRLGVHTLDDLRLRRLGSYKTLHALMQSYPYPANSDYYPVLDQMASRSRFLWHSATDFLQLRQLPAIVNETLDPTTKNHFTTTIGENYHFPQGESARLAMNLVRISRGMPAIERFQDESLKLKRILKTLELFGKHCATDDVSSIAAPQLHEVADMLLPLLHKQQFAEVWPKLFNRGCITMQAAYFQKWYHLYTAIGERDHPSIIKYAKMLLPQKNIAANQRNEYLLLVLMNSLIAEKNKAEGLAIWKRYSKKQNPPLALRLLVAHLTITKSITTKQ